MVRKVVEAMMSSEHREPVNQHTEDHPCAFDNGTTRFLNAAFLNERDQPMEPAGKIHVIDV